jgi:hypothetical protein
MGFPAKNQGCLTKTRVFYRKTIIGIKWWGLGAGWPPGELRE